MKKIATLLFFCICSLLAFNAVGGTTLDEQIQKHCKTKCVDSTVLLDAAVAAADSFDVDFRLILAVIAIESGFIVKAKNRGNVGLMQVLLRYHKGKFKRNVFDPHENIRVGTSILKECSKLGRSTKRILTCYNGGANPHYGNKVLAEYREFKNVVF